MMLWRLACRLFGHAWHVEGDYCVRCWRTGYALAASGQDRETTLPCGHPASAVVIADEGTGYCGECALASSDDFEAQPEVESR